MKKYKKIPDYPDYSVSNYGDIKNDNTNRILKLRTNKSGQVIVRLCNSGICKTMTLHRIVGELFIPKITDKNEINHIDGDKTNNNYSNLEWVTKSENELHKYYVLQKCIKPIKLIKNDIIYSFPSLSKASQELDLNTGNLLHLIRGKYKQHKGYKLYNDEL